MLEYACHTNHCYIGEQEVFVRVSSLNHACKYVFWKHKMFWE